LVAGKTIIGKTTATLALDAKQKAQPRRAAPEKHHEIAFAKSLEPGACS
jgi:hypothetical protein